MQVKGIQFELSSRWSFMHELHQSLKQCGDIYSNSGDMSKSSRYYLDGSECAKQLGVANSTSNFDLALAKLKVCLIISPQFRPRLVYFLHVMGVFVYSLFIAWWGLLHGCVSCINGYMFLFLQAHFLSFEVGPRTESFFDFWYYGCFTVTASRSFCQYRTFYLRIYSVLAFLFCTLIPDNVYEHIICQKKTSARRIWLSGQVLYCTSSISSTFLESLSTTQHEGDMSLKRC